MRITAASMLRRGAEVEQEQMVLKLEEISRELDQKLGAFFFVNGMHRKEH
jgi:hypothetical protein